MTCPGCQQRDARIQELEQRIAPLESTLQQLQDRLVTNAAKSSLPPSANPPGAPKPVTKQPTGKKRGAEPGHPPLLRHRLPPQRVTGCRFVERLLTVVQTRRLQGQSVLRYLHEALVAHRNNPPAPSLLPVG